MFKYLIPLFFIFSTIFAQNQNSTIELTAKEKAWLVKNPKITMVVPKNFPRSYLNEDGKLEGMDIDYFNLIEKKLGIKFDKTIMPWHKALKKAMNHEVDIIINAAKLKNRETKLNFTQTYFTSPLAVLTMDSEPNISDLKELCGKTVAVHKGSSKSKFLQKNYPCIKQLEVTSKKDILSSIITKKAYAGFDNFYSLSGNIKRFMLSGFKFAYFKYMPPVGYSRVAVRNDKPLLVSIIDKAIGSISIEEKNKIISKWISIELPLSSKEIELSIKDKANFTKEEKDYISSKTITIGMVSDYYPFSFKNNDKIDGYSYEFINLVIEKSGLKVKIKMDNWSNTLNKFKTKQIDIIDAISYKKSREIFTNFSQPYYEIPNVIFARKGEFNNYTGFKSLKGKRVGITKDIFYYDTLKDLQLFELVEFKSSKNKMKALAYGKVDVIFNNLISGQKYIKRGAYSNIKVIEELDSSLVKREDLRLGIKKEDKVLFSIINKSIDAITTKEKNSLVNKWFGVSLKYKSKKSNLSDDKKRYLKENTEITYAGDPNWLPFEAFDKQGNYIGIVSEHIKIIEKKLDLKFKKIITKDWTETLELSKISGVDIISGDAADVVLAKNYKPIDTYIQNPLVIVTRDDHPFVTNLNHLKDKKIAYANGGGYASDIVKKYPNIKFLITDTIHTGLLGVKSGKYDVFIGTLAMTDYSIIDMGIEGIKISGDTGITMNLTLFVNKNKPILYSILNKTMNSISNIEKHKIIAKWRHNKKDNMIVDYTLVWQIIIIFVIIILIGISFLFISRKNNKKLEELLDTAIEGMAIFQNGKLIKANKPLFAMYGYNSVDEVRGKDASCFFDKTQTKLVQEQLKKEHVIYEVRMKRKDGTLFPTLTKGTNLGSNIRVSSVIDITELKDAHNKLEELNQTLESKIKDEVEKNKQQQLMMLQQSRLAQMGEMISMIAHQWRQPLNSLSMLNQALILKYNRDKLTKIFINSFKKDSNMLIQNMSKTIDDFRDFFKPEKEKVEFSINEIIINTIDMVKPIFTTNKIDIIFDNQEDTNILGYPNELGQAILNIVNNAKDALVGNGKVDKYIKIEIRTDNNSIILTISDNASGIPDDIIDKIFDPYFSTKNGKNGTGLGLYMSKIIIEDHMDGKIEVSNDDFGAVFNIKLLVL